MSFFSKKTIAVTAITILGVAGAVAAAPQVRNMERHRGGYRMMTSQLGLTDAQKAQAKAIFQAAWQSAKPVRQELRQERQAVQAAIKAGKSAQEIEQLAKVEGTDMGQLAAIRASAFAKFYSTLTPDQKQKLESLHQSRHEHKAATS